MATPIIHIPEPCSENWNNMQPVDGCKRHCEVCKINLYDFSKSSLSDIQKTFAENKDVKICGNYHERHTNNTKTVYIVTNKIDSMFSKTRLKAFSLIAISMVLFLSGCGKRAVCGGYGSVKKVKDPHTTQTRI